MERRNFLIGMGSAAAGSAAMVGSGAFNFANVERDVSVDVVDDSRAFLALEDTSAYADGSDDKLELTFDDAAGVGGDGINKDADYSFTGVFSIRNQGSQPVGVWINDDDENDAANWYGTDTEGNDDFTTSIEGPSNAYSLDVGERVYVNVVLLTRENDASALPEQINVVADASQGN